MNIIRQTVKSSQISSIGYDQESMTLEIQFHTGGVYRYAPVPEVVYLGLVNAQSIGTFFGQSIRNNYPTTKLCAFSGVFEPIETAHASVASKQKLLRMLVDAGMHHGGRDDFPTKVPDDVFNHASRYAIKTPLKKRETMGEWLDALTQRQCSAAIEFLKEVRT